MPKLNPSWICCNCTRYHSRRYEESIFTWVDENTVEATTSPFFDLLDESGVNVSGLSSSIIGLQDTFAVGIKTDVIGLAKCDENVIVSGRIDDIYVDRIPNQFL